MFRQKYLSLFIIAMMFFVIASGGCGGSSSSNRHENDNSNPDDPTTEYDISVLLGEWVASDGTATQREDNENFDLVMLEDGGSLSFNNIQLNGDIMSIDIDGYTHWEYLNGSRRGSQSSRNYYVDHPREFQHIGVNIWQAWYKGVDDHKYTITITSPTTATFEENINDATYGWTTHFTLTKQSATTETEYDISVLEGTWAASNGEGTASDGSLNFSMSISSGHSSTVSFSDVSVIGDNATLLPESQIYWDVSQSGTRILSDIHDDFGGGRTLEFQRTGTNTWQMSRTRSSGHIEKTIITLTSLTTANVERDGYYDDDVYKNAHYHMSYIITKQDTL